MLYYTNIFLISAIAFSLIKLLIVENIWNKLLYLNLISVKVLLVFTIFAVSRNDANLLDTSLTFAIVSFLVVVLISRFILSGGRTK